MFLKEQSHFYSAPFYKLHKCFVILKNRLIVWSVIADFEISQQGQWSFIPSEIATASPTSALTGRRQNKYISAKTWGTREEMQKEEISCFRKKLTTHFPDSQAEKCKN